MLRQKYFVMAAALAVVLLTAACSVPTPQVITVEVTRVVSETVKETVVVTQMVEVEKVITATPAPTEAAPTPEASPAAAQPVVAPAAASAPVVSADGVVFDAWCTPPGKSEDTSYQAAGVRPASGVWAMHKVASYPALHTENSSCTFLFTFPQPIQAGTKFVIYDAQGKPWVENELTPTTANPNAGYTTTSQVTIPQYWYSIFKTAVNDPTGTAVWNGKLMLITGETPQLCYDGLLPDAARHKCPGYGEAHPWDPWYGWKETGGKYED